MRSTCPRTRCWRRCSRTCRPTIPSGWRSGWARCSAGPTLQRAIRRVSADALPAHRQGPDRGETRPLGAAAPPVGQEAGLPADPEFRSAFSSYIEWGSRLALENSQPGAKPPQHMPMPHWDWHTAAGPPGSRISALEDADGQDRLLLLPHPSEPVSFEQHIKTLFRHRDRQSMKFAFDLWSYDDVKHNAHAILQRVRNGSMPCDGAWTQDKVDALERWVTTGMRP